MITDPKNNRQDYAFYSCEKEQIFMDNHPAAKGRDVYYAAEKNHGYYPTCLGALRNIVKLVRAYREQGYQRKGKTLSKPGTIVRNGVEEPCEFTITFSVHQVPHEGDLKPNDLEQRLEEPGKGVIGKVHHADYAGWLE